MRISSSLLPSLSIRAEAVLRVVEEELPESAALLRLSGMEVTECLSEVRHVWEGGGGSVFEGWGPGLAGWEACLLHVHLLGMERGYRVPVRGASLVGGGGGSVLGLTGACLLPMSLSSMGLAYLYLLIEPPHTCCRYPRWDRTFPVV